LPFFFYIIETNTSIYIYYNMIKWTDNSTNIFEISISDTRKVSKGTTPYFFMEVENDMTKVKKAFYCTLVEQAARYVKLSVTEPSTVNLVEQGFYKYTIWETSNDTLTSVNYTSILGDEDLVHKGKLYYDDTANTEVSYTQYTPTSNKNTTNSNTTYLSI